MNAAANPAAPASAAAAPVTVVKAGGARGVDLAALTEDVARHWRAGHRLVLVHGGGAETDDLATRLGRPPRFVESPSGLTSRYTDRAALEIFEMALCGKINKGIVERLQALGVNAVGLAGMDGRILSGRRKESVRSVENGRTMVLHGDHTGIVDRVNTSLLNLLLDAGHLPVVCPPAISDDGVAINVDADRAAAAIAAALGAESLLLLSNVPGLLARFPDEDSLVRHIPLAELDAFMPLAAGRMRKKLMGAAEAVRGGVPSVILGDARCRQPVGHALQGNGTRVDAGGPKG